ncbi:hypothetical protein PFISCL1PPCAC_27828, partial [Pristionchus fissidentatus]
IIRLRSSCKTVAALILTPLDLLANKSSYRKAVENVAVRPLRPCRPSLEQPSGIWRAKRRRRKRRRCIPKRAAEEDREG